MNEKNKIKEFNQDRMFLEKINDLYKKIKKINKEIKEKGS